MAEHRVTWFEEPVSSDDLTGLAGLRALLDPDIAAGEYSWSLADSAALIKAGAVDCLQVDVTRCGGITGFIAAAELAAAHGRRTPTSATGDDWRSALNFVLGARRITGRKRGELPSRSKSAANARFGACA